MRREYIECEQCKNRQQIKPVLYGNSRYHWLFVSKSISESGDLFCAGEYSFCSEGCLKKFILQK